MWGLFRKRDTGQGEQSSAADERAQYDTEPIGGSDGDTRAAGARADFGPGTGTEPRTPRAAQDPAERDLGEGVPVGESPSEWLDQARAARTAERPASDGAEPADADHEDAGHDTDRTAGHEADASEPVRPSPTTPPERDEAADAAVAATRERWVGELAQIGGPSPLRDFRGERGTCIDLTVAHPSGIAPLLAGRPVLLSDLLREPLAFRTAREAADLITRKSDELEAARGIDAVQVAMGIAGWDGVHGGDRIAAPVLLRSASLRRSGRDYEVKLRGSVRVNGTLLRELYADGVTVRASELLGHLGEADTFLPEGVFAHLRNAGAELPGFHVDARVVLSCFADVAAPLVADARARDGGALAHPILTALAGDPAVRDQLAASRRSSAGDDPDRRDPSRERLLLDADTEQERVLDDIAAGTSLVVDALPGAGLTQTVVNAIGRLVDADRRVLVVAPRSASIRSIRSRLKQVGLEGLAVTPRTLRRDLIAGITRNERAARPSPAELDDALVRLRRALRDYRHALLDDDAELGVSPLDALESLSRLELLDVPPSTTARLDTPTLLRLRSPEAREKVCEQLRELGMLGQFRFGPDDTPWFGVQFSSTDEVERVRTVARDLADGEVADVISAGASLLGQTHLAPPQSFAQLGLYLRLLADIRETLDRFTPELFDADLAELIDATGNRREGSELPAARRRELRQFVREFVRPGVTVNDLHESLKFVQRQRILWQRYVVDGALPSVPTGIEELRVRYREALAQLRIVEEPISESGQPSLIDGPIENLQPRLRALADDADALDTVLERLAISEDLTEAGLGGLLEDLVARHVDADEAGDELELAWWQSALERLLTEKKALLNANTHVLARLEADFRVVDAAHTRSSADRLAWQLAQAWKVALVDDADEAEPLRALLRTPGASAGRLAREAGRLSRPLGRVWLATPYDVPLLPDTQRFDTVIVLDAAALLTSETIAAIRRGRQLVAIGDPVTQCPSPFTVQVRPMQELAAERERIAARAVQLDGDSLYAQAASFLPTRELNRSYRAGGEDLSELVNERFYGGRLETMPWAGAFLGHSSLTYSYVEGGTGMPDPATGTVESTDAEVTRVVEFVVDHALRRPRESLMVVTASAIHARRVEQAVWSAVSQRPEIEAAFTMRRLEPFLVTTIEGAAAQSRDRVVFSLGYGVTPHGRVLSDFGALAGPLGERMLAVAMTRARRSLVIVSCVKPAQLDLARLTPGTIALAEILTELEERPATPGAGFGALDESTATMLVDLGRRLASFGMRVELDYRGRIPLAAAYGARAIAIDLDGERGEDLTLREELRLRPEQLKRLGWYYLRVHAFELFANPDTVARRIASALDVPIGEDTREERLALASGRRGVESGARAIGAIEVSSLAADVDVLTDSDSGGESAPEGDTDADSPGDADADADTGMTSTRPGRGEAHETTRDGAGADRTRP